MKITLDCIPCFLNQTLVAARKLALSEAATESLQREMLAFLSVQDWQRPPPVIAREVHRLIRKHTGNPDPYFDQKMMDTKNALALLPEIEANIAASSRPFLLAVRYAIAGNAIDFGAANGWNPSVSSTFQKALKSTLDEGNVSCLEHEVSRAESIMYLTDNCGEIVFDRPLLNLIGTEKVTVAVRGRPVLNDATMDDAKRSGIAERYRTIANGSDVPGTWLNDCSDDFGKRFETADLIIAKGQGNYECLSNVKRRICFLFMVKCPFVAGQVGMSTGAYAIYLNRAERGNALEIARTHF